VGRDVRDARFGRPERLGEQGREPVQPALDRLGMLCKASGNRLQRFPSLGQARLHQLVGLAELRVDVA
jgi:hypothetical protein